MLKKILLILSLLLLFIVAGGIVLSLVYEKEVKSYIVSELNNYLKSEVKVGEIEFSVLERFPNASLKFNNILMYDAVGTPSTDTLFYAEDLFLKFSIFDLFRGRYIIQKSEINNAGLNLKFFKNGSDNYHFWQSPNDSTAAARVQFNLEDVTVDNLHFTLLNELNNLSTNVLANSINVSGSFADEIFNLKTDADLFIKNYASNEVTYIQNKNLEGDFLLEINNLEKKYTFREGTFNFEDLPLSINGYFQKLDENLALNITLAGSNMDINHLNNLLPETYKKNLGEYKARGKLDINARLEGKLGAGGSTNVETDFQVSEGQFTEKENGVTMSRVELKGNYQSRGNKPDRISFEKLSANLGMGTFSGQGVIEDFKIPYLDFFLEGKLNLSEVSSFFRLDNFEIMEGEVLLDSHFKGKLQSNEKITAEDWNKASTSGTFSISNGKIKLKDHHHIYSQINGTILLHNNDAAVRELKGKIQNSDISLTGYFRNFFSYLFLENQQLTIEANLVSDKINLNELLEEKETRSQPDTNYRISFPQKLRLNLNAEIGEIIFRKFKAEAVKGKVRLRNKTLSLEPFTFKTAGGSFESTITFTEKPNGNFITQSNAKLRNIQVEQLFTQFENFGQVFLQDKNIRGIASADVLLKADFSNRLEFNTDNLYSLIDIEIDKGQLLNLSALKDISDYVRGNMLISPMVNNDEFEKTLQNIKFSQLKNSIEIKDRKIYIPQMEIKSNTVDINISGLHSFDNKIDYKLDFRLSQLLTNRRINRSEFGEVSDDGTGSRIFLAMTGTVDNPQFDFDSESARKRRKEVLEQEKTTLKTILKQEFGLFKKDSTLTKEVNIVPDEKPKTQYDVEWGEEEKDQIKQDQPTQKPKEEKEKKGFFNRLFEDDEEIMEDSNIYNEIEDSEDY